uniref:Uncharacterized protein n=1 Tax=Chromera velia CCMP2878 TaxID=1169474 RepID=A0A0G4HUK1_9ALVE|eukprot:Cvel_8665.t1-p1 / transcript=Cvel_8665.t1 / gene=Cvel_8665 / organism=Chromera_velia_CCMP2878 / gene_product=hypothetical protein / transcript_product=hypothetical protein / location=Cvel_scaffold483:52059-55070(+) / protein_length=454 / sequence_SO=supercontig / SO=protein_coding / is_pseudo=false
MQMTDSELALEEEQLIRKLELQKRHLASVKKHMDALRLQLHKKVAGRPVSPQARTLQAGALLPAAKTLASIIREFATNAPDNEPIVHAEIARAHFQDSVQRLLGFAAEALGSHGLPKSDTRLAAAGQRLAGEARRLGGSVRSDSHLLPASGSIDAFPKRAAPGTRQYEAKQRRRSSQKEGGYGEAGEGDEYDDEEEEEDYRDDLPPHGWSIYDAYAMSGFEEDLKGHGAGIEQIWWDKDKYRQWWWERVERENNRLEAFIPLAERDDEEFEEIFDTRVYGCEEEPCVHDEEHVYRLKMDEEERRRGASKKSVARERQRKSIWGRPQVKGPKPMDVGCILSYRMSPYTFMNWYSRWNSDPYKPAPGQEEGYPLHYYHGEDGYVEDEDEEDEYDEDEDEEYDDRGTDAQTMPEPPQQKQQKYSWKTSVSERRRTSHGRQGGGPIRPSLIETMRGRR